MRVVHAQLHTRCLQHQGWRLPGGVDVFGVQTGQRRDIAADELARSVKLFALADRVEDAEIGLGVTAAGADPLPAVPMKDRDIFDLLGFD